MKNRLPVLAAALIGLPLLLLSGCSSTSPAKDGDISPAEDGDNHYFGVRNGGKRFVPKELQEDETY
jgi:hypothetical protein